MINNNNTINTPARIDINFNRINCIALLNLDHTKKDFIVYDIFKNDIIYKSIPFLISWLNGYTIEDYLKLQINTDFKLKWDLSINNILKKE
jgi:hypothetical protein